MSSFKVEQIHAGLQKARDLKATGNEHFKEGRAQEAMRVYHEAQMETKSLLAISNTLKSLTGKDLDSEVWYAYRVRNMSSR